MEYRVEVNELRPKDEKGYNNDREIVNVILNEAQVKEVLRAIGSSLAVQL